MKVYCTFFLKKYCMFLIKMDYLRLRYMEDGMPLDLPLSFGTHWKKLKRKGREKILLLAKLRHRHNHVWFFKESLPDMELEPGWKQASRVSSSRVQIWKWFKWSVVNWQKDLYWRRGSIQKTLTHTPSSSPCSPSSHCGCIRILIRSLCSVYTMRIL